MNIEIKVKLFAIYQEVYQADELKIFLSENSPVSQVLEYVIREQPALEAWRAVTRFGVNKQFADPTTILQKGDEVVLIPPVSGG